MVAVALAALLAQSQITGERSVIPKCEVSADATYGYTKENPIKVGGLQVYGPPRQRRFLQSLVGPAGQPITFRRTGSHAPPEGIKDVILDRYEISYAGLAEPVHLFLDQYRWDPPKAPQGFACAMEIGIVPPGPDGLPPPGTPASAGGGPPLAQPGRPVPPSWDRIFSMAVELGMKELVEPVPLDPSGSLKYGAAFDPFTRIARAAHAFRGSGQVPASALSTIRNGQTLIVAVPVDCAGRTAKPQSIEVAGPDGRRVAQNPTPFTGDALTRMLPSFTAPEGSLGVIVAGTQLPPNGTVVLGYDEPACGDSKTISLKVSYKAGGPNDSLRPVWPIGAEGAPGSRVQVRVGALIDHQGVPHDVQVWDGPEMFRAAAIEAISRARMAPLVINGVTVKSPRPATFTLTFVK